MSGHSTDNTDLPVDAQNEMDYAAGNPLVAERGSSLFNYDQYYDCVEQLSNTEAHVHSRLRNPSSATELLAPSVVPRERNTTYGDMFGSCNMSNTPQQPASGTSQQTVEEQKIAKKLKNLRISNHKRCDKQALSAVLRNLQDFGEEIKEAGLTPEHRNSEPCLGPSTKTSTPEPKVSEIFTKKPKEKDKPSISSICGPPGASVSCTLDLKKTASASDSPAEEINTASNLRLDSLEDYFRLDLNKRT